MSLPPVTTDGVAAIATPGGDLVSPTVLGTVMYVLYEFTIQLIRRRGR